jgi:hypothetical protein
MIKRMAATPIRAAAHGRYNFRQKVDKWITVAPGEMQGSRPMRRHLLLASLVLFIAVLAVYWPVHTHGYMGGKPRIE